jgi:periplasmic protein TonB
MSRANHVPDPEFRATLPADLQELDRELRAIRVEERPSFGPELEAELARAWAARQNPAAQRSRPWTRLLLAAGVAGLMVAGLSVPGARASVWEVVRAILGEATPALEPPTQELRLPGIRVDAPTAPPVVTAAPIFRETPRETPRETVRVDDWEPFLPVREVTFPQLLQGQETERIIRSHYPVALQRAGVGGAVRVMFWLDSLGVPDNIQVREGSGFQALDYAAMRAARDLRFEPATRDGVPVGTWVEFVIRFVPDPETLIPEPDPEVRGP